MFEFIKRWFSRRKKITLNVYRTPTDDGANAVSEEIKIADKKLTSIWIGDGMRIVSEEIKIANKKLTSTWTVDIVSGWPIYFVPHPAEDTITWEQKYDERAWQYDTDKRPQSHRKIGFNDIREGLVVIWKGNFSDHMWNAGVIQMRDGTWYVESPENSFHWSPADFDTIKSCWVTHGACYAADTLRFNE